MPFCNWCQLESDADDFCVWCKRPITRSHSFYGNVALLREEPEPSADRWTGIVGSFVVALFLGVVIYASVNYGKDQTKIQQAERTDHAPLQGTRGTPSAAPALTVAAVAPPPVSTSREVSATSPREPSTPSAPPEGATAMFPANVSLTTDGGIVVNPLYFETATLDPRPGKDGSLILEGEAYLVNVSGYRATDLQFWVTAGAERLVLEPSSNQIAHGDGLRIVLKGTGLKASAHGLAEARLYVSGNVNGQRVSDSLAVRSSSAPR